MLKCYNDVMQKLEKVSDILEPVLYYLLLAVVFLLRLIHKLQIISVNLNCRKLHMNVCKHFSGFMLQNSLSRVHPLWESVDLVPGGDQQSPINIWWRDSVYDAGLKPLTISYDPATCLHVWNNGYSFLVEFEDSTHKSGCTGNMLLTSVSGEVLKLCLLMLEGHGEPARRDHMLHLVHWNAVIENFEDAAPEENGLAVIGVFLKENSQSPLKK
ncbi:carbonic anhydrase 5B, mitochondrial-like [Trachypithecus francoisi]|uniref:carbonic anhydrase 5B, mitochondrial-like n=1 Tax=Trachypithecus francoisi TaxID=54180 RepID=UPI00141BEAF5|nr:carbonic anhydrase 5B, mitochondrial-like [Trachypithecus francoisi]